MIYRVNIAWYSIDAFFGILASAARVAIVIVGLAEYFRVTVEMKDETKIEYAVNIIAITTLFLCLPLYFYRALIHIIEVINYFTTKDQFIPIKFKTFDYFVDKDTGDPTFGFFSYTFMLFCGPMKMSLLADTFSAIFVGLAH